MPSRQNIIYWRWVFYVSKFNTMVNTTFYVTAIIVHLTKAWKYKKIEIFIYTFLASHHLILKRSGIAAQFLTPRYFKSFELKIRSVSGLNIIILHTEKCLVEFTIRGLIQLHDLVSYKATTYLVVVTISDRCNDLGNTTIWLVTLPIMGSYSYY